jgi:hypothetical protein
MIDQMDQNLLSVADLGCGALDAIAPSPKKNFRFSPAEKT